MIAGWLQSVIVEITRGLSTSATLWAAQTQCAPCSPVLHCPATGTSPACICQGENRVCPALQCGSCYTASVFFVGALLGALGGIWVYRRLGSRTVNTPLITFVDSASEEFSRTAREQAASIRLKRHAISR